MCSNPKFNAITILIFFQVVRNVTTVQVKINSTEYFRKTISATGPLDLQILVLGSANNTSDDSPNNPPVRNFKGVIQDVQVSIFCFIKRNFLPKYATIG